MKNQIGGSRLAIRAGHANHSELAGREVVKRRRKVGQGKTRVFDLDVWDGQFADRLAADHCHRPTLNRRWNIAMSIHSFANQGDEQAAWLDGSRIEGNVGNRNFGQAARCKYFDRDIPE